LASTFKKVGQKWLTLASTFKKVDQKWLTLAPPQLLKKVDQNIPFLKV
jgi:hypothetical protein